MNVRKSIDRRIMTQCYSDRFSLNVDGSVCRYYIHFFHLFMFSIFVLEGKEEGQVFCSGWM